MIISIQGIKGSFHDIAARQMYGKNISLLERDSFQQVFVDVKNQNAQIGIVAIENSIAGSLLENYDLLLKYGIPIIGETYLRIQHNLLALDEQDIGDIREIHSHPMAFKQCQRLLAKLDVKLVAKADTAASAKAISENKLRGIGAIASNLSAELYGLKVLAAEIADNKQNYTRFLAIGNSKYIAGKPNKISIATELKHAVGSLARFLNIFNEQKLNLTKIESRPIVGKPWHYRFYIDYEITPAAINKIAPLIAKLGSQAENIKLLGAYCKAQSFRTTL